MGPQKARQHKNKSPCGRQKNRQAKDLSYTLYIAVPPELGCQDTRSADNSKDQQIEYKKVFICQSHGGDSAGSQPSDHQSIHHIYYCI